MPKNDSMAPTDVHQFKVTLRGVKPPVWRRVLVPSDFSLRKVHDVLQIVMGWTDTHLYEFTAGRTDYGDRDEDAPWDLRSARMAKLFRIAPSAGAKLLYKYDFGDGWEHDVVVEAILQPAGGMRYPVCVAGKRACPPEDCGGPYGYAELLEALGDPEHPEHEEKVDWIGDDLDPEAFDLDEINASLRRIR
jgi:hypothetical protein